MADKAPWRQEIELLQAYQKHATFTHILEITHFGEEQKDAQRNSKPDTPIISLRSFI